MPVVLQGWAITALENGSLPADFQRRPAACDADSGGRYAGSVRLPQVCRPPFHM